MAGTPDNQNAVGNSGGKPLNDRRKMAKLRGLVVDKAIELFETPIVKMSEDDYQLFKDVFLKLSGNVLPRLNEISGNDGEELKISFDKAFKEALKDKEPKDGATSEPAKSDSQPGPVQGSESGEKKR